MSDKPTEIERLIGAAKFALTTPGMVRGRDALQDAVNAIESRPTIEQRALDTVESLLDGLDSNGDPEVCGLSQEHWDERVRQARALLREAGRVK